MRAQNPQPMQHAIVPAPLQAPLLQAAFLQAPQPQPAPFLQSQPFVQQPGPQPQQLAYQPGLNPVSGPQFQAGPASYAPLQQAPLHAPGMGPLLMAHMQQGPPHQGPPQQGPLQQGPLHQGAPHQGLPQQLPPPLNLPPPPPPPLPGMRAGEPQAHPNSGAGEGGYGVPAAGYGPHDGEPYGAADAWKRGGGPGRERGRVSSTPCRFFNMPGVRVCANLA